MHDYITIEKDLYESLLEKEAYLKCLKLAIPNYLLDKGDIEAIFDTAMKIYNERNEVK